MTPAQREQLYRSTLDDLMRTNAVTAARMRRDAEREEQTGPLGRFLRSAAIPAILVPFAFIGAVYVASRIILLVIGR